MRVVYDANLNYEELFKKANEALGLADGTINSLTTYYAYLEELMEESPEFLRIPLDEEPFEIRTNTREIVIPADIAKNNLWIIGVKDDHMAEVLFFSVDRFFDGQDLAICFPKEGDVAHQGQTYVQWKNGALKGLDAVTYVEIQEEKIYFGWVLTSGRKESNAGGPLSVAGNLTFSVRFQYQAAVNNDGQPDLESQTLFSLNTLTATCKVAENLIQSMGSEIQSIASLDVEDISDLGKVRPRFSGIFNNVLGPKPRITSELAEYADLDENDEVELSVEATVAGGGELVYKWTKDGVVIEGADTNSYTVKYDGEDITGMYSVLVGHEYAPDKLRYDESSCEIPGPSKIVFETNGDLITDGLANGNTVLEPKVEIKNNIYGNRAGSLHYEWYREALDGEVIEVENPISTAATYTPAIGEAGKYSVKITNVHNKKQGSVEEETALESIVSIMKAPAAVPTSIALVHIDEEIVATVEIEHKNDLWYRWNFTADEGNTNPSGATNWTAGLNKYPYYGAGLYTCQVKQVIYEGVEGGYAEAVVKTEHFN